MIPSQKNIIGKILRLPFKFFKKGTIVRVLFGPNKGLKFIIGASNHSTWVGFYEKNLVKKMVSLMSVGDIVYDLGANVGYISLAASRQIGNDGKVYAFEPDSRNIKFFKDHINLNNINNVILFEKAVSNQDGFLKFDNSGSRLGAKISESGTTTVETVSLNNLIKNGELLPPNFLKIDVEGAEMDVLSDIHHVLTEFKPKVFLSTHGNEMREKCLSFLKGINYNIEPLIDAEPDKVDEYYAYFAG